MYKIYLFLIMQFVFISYLSFIWIIYGKQKSISRSYYALPPNLRMLFTFFCWGFALPAIILGVEQTPLMFFAGAGICFVGAASEIDKPFVMRVHMPAAILGIVFSQLAIVLVYNMWYLTVGYAISIPILYLLSKQYFIWWIEIIAFLLISVVLGLTIFQLI